MTRRDDQSREVEAEWTAPAQLSELADAAKGAADRACVAVDDALDFIEASNQRIEAMEKMHREPQ